ncbi:Bro-N domain-containing protein [Pseudomonas sp. NPDC090202]|uniref:BRO-N domain-containing protein n=1 Tax=unclassified Pseudomonas TaxID=196821 RepID=UPI00380B63E2
MIDCFEAKRSIRHLHPLRARQLGHQAWFCLQDIAGLMGTAAEELATHKLDPDQRRNAWLQCSGHWSKQSLISESGLYALLAHHDTPQNRLLRQWVTHQVLPMLRKHPLRDTSLIRTLRWTCSPVGPVQWLRLTRLWAKDASGSMKA